MNDGIPKDSHTTANANDSPKTAAEAARRYGLEGGKTVELEVTIPKGQSVKTNKVVGGEPGRGEILLDKPLPPDAITGSRVLP